MSADDTTPRRLTPSQAVTPAVLRVLQATIDETPAGERPDFAAAQCVLRHLARWARGGECSDSIGQIAAGTLLGDRKVRRCLHALDAAGIARVATRGGGRARVATRRVLWLDWGADGVLRSPHEPVDNPPTTSGHTDGVETVDNQELRPSERTEIPDDETPTASVSDATASVCGPTPSVQTDASDLVPTIDPTATPPTPLVDETSRAERRAALAQEAGDLYAQQTRMREPVKSLEGLSNWKRNKLLNDRLERKALDTAIDHAEKYAAWSEREIPIAELAAAVLAGNPWKLHERYPQARPVQPTFEVLEGGANEQAQETAKPEPSGLSPAELMRQAGAPRHLIRRKGEPPEHYDPTHGVIISGWNNG